MKEPNNAVLQQIENIDIQIQELINSKEEKSQEGKGMIDAKIEGLMQEKRALQRMLQASGERTMDWTESQHLFHGEDVTQRKQHFKSKSMRVLNELRDMLKRLETKARSNKESLSQGIRIKISELKSMHEKLSDMALEIPHKTDDEFSSLQVEFEDTLQEFRETYEYTEKQFR